MTACDSRFRYVTPRRWEDTDANATCHLPVNHTGPHMGKWDGTETMTSWTNYQHDTTHWPGCHQEHPDCEATD